MEDLLSFILECVLEVLFQLIFEEGVAAVLRARRGDEEEVAPAPRPHRPFRFVPFVRLTLGRTNPPLTVLKFTLLGIGLGFVSALVLPHPLVHPSRFHGISLLISPVITGLIMGFIGRMVRRRGKTPVRIESFAYGFTFAFAMTLIRLLMAR